jgi:hypothetical protein
MEACGSTYHWAREIARLDHEVKLIPPVYVKPYVKRQKKDAADAGKQRLGHISKMGDLTLWGILISVGLANKTADAVGGRQSVEGVWRNSSVRRDRKKQDLLLCLEHVCLILIRSANSHTGQEQKLHEQAGQMAASDHARLHEIPACLPRGVHRCKRT